jgi:hypothetical protein
MGGMELRLLKTNAERERFRAGMLEARASRGARFREKARSRVSEIQMTFARLYGLFDGSKPEVMLGGFSIHCLNEFSQSFPIPNLSHLSTDVVYEAGQLWAFTHEAARALRKGAMILVGLFQAQALLIYPLIIPRDVSTLYRVFKWMGPPFELPYAETVTGEKVYMQAMLLEGNELRQQVLASREGFETYGEHSMVRFDAPNAGSKSSARRFELKAVEGARGVSAQPEGSERPVTTIDSLGERTRFEANAPLLSTVNGIAKLKDPGENSSCQ